MHVCVRVCLQLYEVNIMQISTSTCTFTPTYLHWLCLNFPCLPLIAIFNAHIHLSIHLSCWQNSNTNKYRVDLFFTEPAKLGACNCCCCNCRHCLWKWLYIYYMHAVMYVYNPQYSSLSKSPVNFKMFTLSLFCLIPTY